MKTWQVIALAVASGGAHLVFREAGLFWPALIAKPVPVLCLALLVGRTNAGPKAGTSAGPRQRWLLAGLLLSALGDLILALPDAIGPNGLGTYSRSEMGALCFMAGLGAFLLAHICYIVWFAMLAHRARPAWLVGPVAYSLVFLAFLWPHLGAMLVPVVVYAGVITAMLWRALAVAADARPILLQPAAWGALLFVLSDSLIAIDRFVAPLPAAALAIMLTYWSGQCGIFLTHRLSDRRGLDRIGPRL